MICKFFLQSRQEDGNYSCVPLPQFEFLPIDNLPRSGDMILAEGVGYFVHAVHHHMSNGYYVCKVYLQKGMTFENGLIACVNCFTRTKNELVLDHEAGLRLERIETLLKEQAIIMTDVNQQLLDLTAAFDTETTAVAAKLDKLQAQIVADAAAAGQTVKPETLAALTAVSDRLKSLGADPVAPIPAPVVEPAAPTTPAV